MPHGGYAWWYLDAISDDGSQACTVIGFIGSVFSPYYAWANRNAPADPERFCAINAVLYGRRAGRWAMTERSNKSLTRRADRLQIGRSTLAWVGGALHATIDERSAPLPRPLRGRILLQPEAIQPASFPLDAAGRHRWHPVAPRARVRVEFDDPKTAWSGHGYFDTNDGDRPLGEDFTAWHWSRGGGKILYDVTRRDGSVFGLALQIGADGSARTFNPPPLQTLPSGLWRVPRVTRADPGCTPRVLETLEDAPFYARSVIATSLAGEAVTCMHESLSLARFGQPWVRMLLPFRMPRW
ncbi:MAG: carotenoid 1,2-hydratase [Acidocella sp. 20-63-7]|nr:MAG: carotenoid 1,2-hydratase [Acidocella sp. 20-63-7]